MKNDRLPARKSSEWLVQNLTRNQVGFLLLITKQMVAIKKKNN